MSATNDRQAITGSASVAAPRKSLKFVGSASRRRAAPRGQSSGAAKVAQCHFIGQLGPLLVFTVTTSFTNRVLRQVQ